MSLKDNLESFLHNALTMKWPTAGLTVGGGTTAMSAKESSFMSNIWESGILTMFEGWTLQDTFTVIGLCFTACSLYLAREQIKVNKRQAQNKEEENRIARVKLNGRTDSDK